MGLWELFRVFAQIGLLSIGGGYAIIPFIQELVVLQEGWISQQTFMDIITISQMTPGPLAVNTSTWVGLQIAGMPGAMAATFGCVLSGVILSLGMHLFFHRFHQSDYMLETLQVLRSSSLGLIVSAAATLLLGIFLRTNTISLAAKIDWIAIAVFAGSLIVLRKWKLNPMLIMVLAGMVGGLVAY